MSTDPRSATSDGIADTQERILLQAAQKHAVEAMEMIEVARQM
jgi:hypothetical protein